MFRINEFRKSSPITLTEYLLFIVLLLSGVVSVFGPINIRISNTYSFYINNNIPPQLGIMLIFGSVAWAFITNYMKMVLDTHLQKLLFTPISEGINTDRQGSENLQESNKTHGSGEKDSDGNAGTRSTEHIDSERKETERS
ncbi:hypothetical protein [Halobaculum sp. EA56]|uniref:hypothetical protein n=1 Tax=Halobaculum sp. EA56 TaxID=3421648 RepID=UPI003EBBFBF1